MTVDAADVRAAGRTLGDEVHRTPVLSSSLLGERAGVRLLLKAELLQKTGSFKPRGALNRLRNTSPEDLERGLVTVSAGNHAQGLAWAARTVGASCTVVMPSNAPRAKVEATRSYGGQVVLHGTVQDAYRRMEELRAERNLLLVHPYDDPLIIAGQGTVGLEIADQAPEVDAVVCPVGGGGLISGVAIAVKSKYPHARVIGVEPEGAAAMQASWQRGEVVQLDEVDTIADGLAAPTVGQHTLPLARSHVDEMVMVSDAEIVEGMRALMRYAKLCAEPGGAAGVAALLAGKAPVRAGECVVAIVTGGNVDLDRLQELFEVGW